MTMPRTDEVRIFRCGACGGGGGHHDFADVWTRCYLCNGEGEFKVELGATTLEDLDARSQTGE